MVVKLALLRGLSRCVWVHVFAYLTVFLRVLLFAGSRDKTVRLWEVATHRELAVLTGHTNYVTSVAFDGSGKYLASGGARGATSSSIADSEQMTTNIQSWQNIEKPHNNCLVCGRRHVVPWSRENNTTRGKHGNATQLTVIVATANGHSKQPHYMVS